MTTDDELLEQLRDVLNAIDGPQARATEAAKAAIGWRDIDADLAQLVFDSRIDDTQGELVMRGDDGEIHQLTFSTDAVKVSSTRVPGASLGPAFETSTV